MANIFLAQSFHDSESRALPFDFVPWISSVRRRMSPVQVVSALSVPIKQVTKFIGIVFKPTHTVRR